MSSNSSSRSGVRYVQKSYVRGLGDSAHKVIQYGKYEPTLRNDGTLYDRYKIVSKEEHAALVSSGAVFAKEKTKQPNYGEFKRAKTPEGRIGQRGVRISADSEAGIKGKRPTLIKESELKYIAKIHHVSPAITSSIIQHADAVMERDIIAYTGYGKGYGRPTGHIEYTPPPVPLTRGRYMETLTPAQRTAIRKAKKDGDIY